MLYPRRVSRHISDIPPRRPRFTNQNDLAMRNTADVSGGNPITVWWQSITAGSAVNPLVAFYDFHWRKGEVLFFCSVLDTNRDIQLHIQIYSLIHTLGNECILAQTIRGELTGGRAARTFGLIRYILVLRNECRWGYTSRKMGTYLCEGWLSKKRDTYTAGDHGGDVIARQRGCSPTVWIVKYMLY
jgi:hypothetical protein